MMMMMMDPRQIKYSEGDVPPRSTSSPDWLDSAASWRALVTADSRSFSVD